MKKAKHLLLPCLCAFLLCTSNCSTQSARMEKGSILIVAANSENHADGPAQKDPALNTLRCVIIQYLVVSVIVAQGEEDSVAVGLLETWTEQTELAPD